MQVDIRKFLFDIQLACEALIEFARDRSLDNYQDNLLLRSGVERQLEIIGEALNQASKIDPTLAEEITGFRQIINLRNVIIHGYASIENETIWGILQNDLPALHEQVRKLLDEKNSG